MTQDLHLPADAVTVGGAKGGVGTSTVAALHAIIPHTGQEPRSEAIEHRLEHQIMRKQEQLDTLRRALGLTDR